MTSTGTSGIPMRPLGTTGVNVSMLCLGGFHLSVPPEDEATRIIHTAIDNGITFMDNAWEYADNESERRMGIALAQDGYRDKVFLMTKNCAHDRTAANSMVKLEESLRRLQTDHLDLWQIHEVTFPDDPDRIFAPGGAAEAMLRAKEEGKVRFIGFTGHKSPAIFRRMLAQGFPWDTLQMPVSVLDANFNSFQTRDHAHRPGAGDRRHRHEEPGRRASFRRPDIASPPRRRSATPSRSRSLRSAPGSTAWPSWSRTCASPATSCR